MLVGVPFLFIVFLIQIISIFSSRQEPFLYILEDDEHLRRGIAGRCLLARHAAEFIAVAFG